MSVVAAKVYKDKIVMAADSIVVHGGSKRTDGDFQKIDEINGMIIGGTGYCQEQSLMWHYMRTHKPDAATEKEVLSFMVEFASWQRNITGSMEIENTYLLAYGGHLFYINGLFVYEVTEYAAIGAGEDFASAALYLGHTPKEAVKVAADLSCFVAEPIFEYIMLK